MKNKRFKNNKYFHWYKDKLENKFHLYPTRFNVVSNKYFSVCGDSKEYNSLLIPSESSNKCFICQASFERQFKKAANAEIHQKISRHNKKIYSLYKEIFKLESKIIK